MSLTPVFGVAIDAERTTITITDQTVYGAPNLVRADCAVWFSAAKVSYENVEENVETSGDDDSPSSDSSWSFSYSLGDGYWKQRWVVIPEYNVSTEYDAYDAIESGGVVYRSKVDSNTGQSVLNTTYWEVISTPTSLADNKGEDTESENIESFVYERVFTSNAQYAYGNLIADNCVCTDCDESEILFEYQLFSLWINGAITADERTLGLSGELLCRKISSRFITE